MSDSSINMKTRAVAKVACSLRAFHTAPGQRHAELSLYPNELYKADTLLFVTL